MEKREGIEMFNQIENLEDILEELERANSLFRCLYELYFSRCRSESMELTLYYKDCTNLSYTIKELVKTQTISLRNSIESCYETQVKVRKQLMEIIEELTQKEVEKKLEQVMVLLDLADLEEWIRKKGLNNLLETPKALK